MFMLDEVAISPREESILKELILGKSNKEIGAVLGITDGTVKEYLHRLTVKLHGRSRVSMAILMDRKIRKEDENYL